MSKPGTTNKKPTVAGLFAGIGGLELGLQSAGFEAELLCEWWEPAQAVLQQQFPDVPLHDDIRTLKQKFGRLPDVDVVTAGFPCTDLSQAGRTAGIHGKASGLVKHMFDLLEETTPGWVVVENVRNMLVLDGGRAMEYLVSEFERLNYRWAYRTVDSRFTGIPQRRQRVIFVASQEADPREVLFADDAGKPLEDHYRDDAFGFYWTEGNTGLGWAQDAVPTLKGGSGLGIPSSPAIWIRNSPPGRAIVTPRITDAEQLQGFPRGWTSSVEKSARPGVRWKLVGNAVTVGVSSWLGKRLIAPGEFEVPQILLMKGMRWPTAACGDETGRWEVPISLWPERRPYKHILEVVEHDELAPLSLRATAGFYSRLVKSKLRYREDFALSLKQHIDWWENGQTE
ncbi:DNA cytosine methyltransferase [Nocardia wallacei]|uniref:DNA cytosine methyltransferase n=1 Tax=Nocardia wallacei TaxID=480035 RepID=UPI002454EB86|nr:DNA (cytosine-5-)-methyltransferase [Nocardia wallacei]